MNIGSVCMAREESCPEQITDLQDRFNFFPFGICFEDNNIITLITNKTCKKWINEIQPSKNRITVKVTGSV